MEVNALALMATTGITGVFGLVFWGVAARYPAAEVGRASAVLSTGSMLSVLASMAVGLMFTRFIGSAGRRARSMVLMGYGVTTALAAVLGAVFAVFVADDALLGSSTDRWFFPVLVVVLALFALQDWVLIGLRAARWVPLEQLVFATVKLGLLVALAVTAQAGGIVLAWVGPAGMAVVVVSPILVRVLHRQTESVEGAVEIPGPRALATILLGEYGTGVTGVVVPLLMPLIVVGRLGTEANAYYALPLLLSEAVTVLLWNVSSSYITEASNNKAQGPALMRRAFRLSCLIGTIGTPFLLLGAPFLLTLLGGAYAAEGTNLLRLMAVALPFTVIVSTYVAAARLRQQMGRVVAIQASSAVLVVGLTLLLIDTLGIDAVGVAFLSIAVLNSAIVSLPLLRIFRSTAAAPAS